MRAACLRYENRYDEGAISARRRVGGVGVADPGAMHAAVDVQKIDHGRSGRAHQCLEGLPGRVLFGCFFTAADAVRLQSP